MSTKSPSQNGSVGHDTLVDQVNQLQARLDDVEFRNAVHELAGDALGGWCQKLDEDGPACHGEVIATYLNDSAEE